MPVVDTNSHLLGVVVLEDIHRASRSPHLTPLIQAVDLMRDDISPLRRDDPLDRALELFVDNDQAELPLVHDASMPRLIGIVRRSDTSAIYLRHMHGGAENGRDYVV